MAFSAAQGGANPASQSLSVTNTGGGSLTYTVTDDAAWLTESPTSGSAPGTVQVTHDGQCIVLGIDGQTIGGYPKIVQVISADLDVLGQLRPGDRVVFRQVSLKEAECLYRQKQELLREWVTRLRTAAGVF